MVGVVVVTHGELADVLVRSAEKIVGEIEALHAVSIEWDDPMDRARERIEEGVRRADRDGGVLLLTDMFGGTPTNLSLTFLEEGRVEIVTGVNLPMLIKFANLPPDATLREVASRLSKQGQGSIYVASEILRQRPHRG